MMEEKLIASCGMNCAVCSAYIGRKIDINKKGFKRVYCEGCIPRGKNCLHMGDICGILKNGEVRFCFECESFPCKRLKSLDKRYSTKYHLSMIENLEHIKKHGMQDFLEKEESKWRCPDCGSSICCHNGLCMECHLDVLKENRQYRWGGER